MADHPVKVPPELFTEWLSKALLQHDAKSGTIAAMMADRAAQWGWDQREPELQQRADQELDACCEWLDREGWSGESRQLRAAARPKPPTLAEKALVQYDRFIDMTKDSGRIPAGCVRDALERLAELEAAQ